MKRVIKNLALSAGAFVVMLLALEGVLRTTHLFGARLSWTEPDPVVGWRFTPGAAYWVRGENDHAIGGRINALGWRDRERAREKPEGTFRVAVIGDSFVEGFQVELDSTFVAIAERELVRRLGVPVEVLNMGRSGMTITEELAVMDEARVEMQADLVVLVFVPRNDIADMNPATADDTMRPFVRVLADGELAIDNSFATSRAFRARRRVNWLKQHSALVSLLAERYNAWRLSRRLARVAPGDVTRSGITGAATLCTRSPDPVYAANYMLWKHVFLNAAADLRRQDGPPLVLMTVPLVYESTEIDRDRTEDPSFDPGFFDEDLAGDYEPYVGLQEAFETTSRATGERLTWSHWNYAGHRLVGRILADRIAQIYRNYF